MVDGKNHFDCLPVEIVEAILMYLSPYDETSTAKLVCRLWHRLILGITKQRLQAFHEAVRHGALAFKTIENRTRIAPLPRFSHGCCVVDDKMYVFGGCSSSNTAFNDLYQLDLKERKWNRPRNSGIAPCPKECATAVVYKQKIVIFGGWCQPARSAMNSSAKFFNDVNILDVPSMSWSAAVFRCNTLQPCERAGHGACVVGSKMVVFGGAQRHLRFNDVWVFNLITMNEWDCPSVGGKIKPPGRFGHSQLALNDNSIIIIGGCGGPSMLFTDVWLLDVENWLWQQIEVRNTLWEAPHLWCHPGVLVNDHVVVISASKRPHLEKTMQIYILDCSHLRTHLFCSWNPPPDISNAPEATSLHSLVVARSEILVFGGIHQQPQTASAAHNTCNGLVSITPCI